MADNIDGIIERIKKAVRLANKTTEAGGARDRYAARQESRREEWHCLRRDRS